jgi:hypothetical protein
VARCFATTVLFDMSSAGGGPAARTLVGSYNFHLVRGTDGWRIDRFRFNLKFIDGNARLEEAE